MQKVFMKIRKRLQFSSGSAESEALKSSFKIFILEPIPKKSNLECGGLEMTVLFTFYKACLGAVGPTAAAAQQGLRTTSKCL